MSNADSETFSQANKSVDDLLKEIDSQSPELKTSSSLKSFASGDILSTDGPQDGLNHSADTIQSGHSADGSLDKGGARIVSNQGVEISHRDLSLTSSTEPLKLTDSNKASLADQSLQRDPDRHFSGPRALNDEEQAENVQAPVVLKSDENGLMKIIPTIHRPLPAIQPSPSDYSIQSMPNIATNKPDLRNVSGSSTDSEKTIALSPHSQQLSSFYKEESFVPDAGFEPQNSKDEAESESGVEADAKAAASSDDSDSSILPSQSILGTEIVNRNLVATQMPAAKEAVSRNVIGRRSASAVSSSTTMTSESDFISANEADYTDDESGDYDAKLVGLGLGNGTGRAPSGHTDGSANAATIDNLSDTDVEADATISNSSSMSVSTTVHQLTEKPESQLEESSEARDLSEVGGSSEVTDSSKLKKSQTIIGADSSDKSKPESRKVSLSCLDNNSGASVIHHTEIFESGNEEKPIANDRVVSQSTVSTSSTFNSNKFVLEVPQFNPDDTSHALDSYKYDPTLKVAPLDTKGGKGGLSVPKVSKDNVFDDVAHRENILDIWSKQEMFRRVSSHSDDFQPLGNHSKTRFLVRSKPPKFVQVIPYSKSTICPSKSSHQYSTFGSAWVKSRMEVLPSGELNHNVNSDTTVFEERNLSDEGSSASITAGSLQETNIDVDEQCSDLDDEGSLSEYEDAKRDPADINAVGEDSASVVEGELKSQTEQKAVGEFTADSSIQSSSCSCLDGSIDLGKYLKHPLDKPENGVEDSFTGDWADFSNENYSISSVSVSGTKPAGGADSSSELLSKLWRDGTLSKKPKAKASGEEAGDNFVHLSVGEMESFMIRKKMTKEKFQIKHANGTAEVVNQTSLKPEQKGLMVDTSNVEDAGDDCALVTDLAIPGGLQGEEKADLIDDLEADRLLESFEIDTHKESTPRATLKEVSSVSDAEKESCVDVENQRPKKDLEQPKKKSFNGEPKSDKIQKSAELKQPEQKPAEIQPPEQTAIKVHLVDGEQGRMFLKLQGLENLRLPDVESRKAKFKVVIDNGIHVLSTEYVGIKKHNASNPINKEFELVVPETLKIVITLKLQYAKMRSQLVEVHERKRVKPKNIFSKMFGGSSIITTTKYVNKPAKYDPLSEYVAEDGSFAKIQIDFDDFKDKITGEVAAFTLDGLNEWKKVKVGGNLKPQPFNVCKLRVQMLFVPRKSKYEVLPSSTKSAIKQVEDINNTVSYHQEGYMYQEGGDIDVWTRRYFKLKGYDLYAHNVDTMKLKAKINLRKVVYIDYPGKKFVDDIELDSKVQGSSSSITSDTAKVSSQRIISETLILNDGFKLMFANGETIDFGCDSKQERTVWVTLIEDIITKNNFRCQPWVKLMSKKLVAKKEDDAALNGISA